MNCPMPSRSCGACPGCRSGWWRTGVSAVTPSASTSGSAAHVRLFRPKTTRRQSPARTGFITIATKSSGSGQGSRTGARSRPATRKPPPASWVSSVSPPHSTGSSHNTPWYYSRVCVLSCCGGGMAMSSRSEAEDWAEELEAVAGRIAPRFGRAEPRRRALAYLQGLLAPLERKNGWHLAEAAGDHTPDGMQEFLARVHWDADALRDDLRAYVIEHLGDDDAVLVLDETGFLKKGTKSAGVHRQYSGTAGRVENCQIGVFLGYASRHGRALIDRALYLPQTWTNDRPRCRDAGIPDEVTFTTKPKIGRAMLERALLAHVPYAWVAGDSVYGADSALRRAIEAAGKGYVLTVTSAQHLGLRPVGDWAKEVPKGGWTRLSAGDGAKGPRLYDWACVPFRGAREGWQKALLIRRSLE